MVNRLRASLLLVALAAAAPLPAAFLPLQLDPPKHDNPLDPLSPQGLARLSVAPTPTPMPGRPQVVALTPLSGTTVAVPCSTQVLYPGSVGRFEVLVRFDRPMDTNSFLQPGAVTSAPPADITSISAVGAQTLDFVLDTVADGGPYPLQLGTHYTFTLSPVIHSANATPLSPTALGYTTGPFAMAELFSGNATGLNNGIFFPSCNIPQALCLAFNGPLDNTVPVGAQLAAAPDPGLITGMSYGAAGGNGAINTVQYTVCGGQPATAYTFAYTGGLKSTGGMTASAVTGLAEISEPLRGVSANYANGSGGSFAVNLGFNYQVNLTAANGAGVVTFSPALTLPWAANWYNDGCGNASVSIQDPISSSNQFIQSGLTETVTVSAALTDLVGGVHLTAPYSFTFYQP
jgi:hypothetical protein